MMKHLIKLSFLTLLLSFSVFAEAASTLKLVNQTGSIANVHVNYIKDEARWPGIYTLITDKPTISVALTYKSVEVTEANAKVGSSPKFPCTPVPGFVVKNAPQFVFRVTATQCTISNA